MIVYLSPVEIAQCEEFALNSVDTHLKHYKARGQVNRDKIIRDIVVGKMGEMAFARHLACSKIGVVGVADFAIHKGRRKKFSADLEFESCGVVYPIHVKSQDSISSDKYGDSWLFQWGGSGFGHTDKVFKSYSELELFACCKVDGVRVKLHGIYKLKDIFDNNLFKEPKLAWFKNTKKALYLKDIEEAGIENHLRMILTSVRL